MSSGKPTPPFQLSLERRRSPPDRPGSASATRANYQAAKVLKAAIFPSGSNPSFEEDIFKTESDTPSNILPFRQVPDPDIELKDAPVTVRKKGKDKNMSKPVLFYGKPSQLKDVLTYVKVSLLDEPDASHSVKTGKLASLFRGPALTWLTNYIEDHDEFASDFDEFVAQVKAAFALDETAEKAQSARALTNLRQRGSAHDYALKFQELQEKAGIPEPTAIALFVKGLKPRIRNAIVLNNEQEELDSCIKEASRIDAQLYYAESGNTFRGQPNTRGGRNKRGQFTRASTVPKHEYT